MRILRFIGLLMLHIILSPLALIPLSIEVIKNIKECIKFCWDKAKV